MTTFRPAVELPRSRRAPSPNRTYECDICRTVGLSYSEVRKISEYPGFASRKRGVVCDACVQAKCERDNANADNMAGLQTETLF